MELTVDSRLWGSRCRGNAEASVAGLPVPGCDGRLRPVHSVNVAPTIATAMVSLFLRRDAMAFAHGVTFANAIEVDPNDRFRRLI